MPGQLAVIGFDGNPGGGYYWPSLTTVQQPIDEMVATAFKIITGKTPSANYVVPHSILVRDSCGCAASNH